MYCLWLKIFYLTTKVWSLSLKKKKKKLEYSMLNGICPVSSEMGTNKSQIKQQEITPQIS